MTTMTDKSELLDRIGRSFADLEDMLARFDETQMTQAYPPDNWTVQDVLAHITHWEAYALERLRDADRGEKPRLLGNISAAEVDRINADALAAGRQKTLEQVRADFRQTHADLVAEVEALPPTSQTEWWGLWPDADFPWQLIFWNTYDHYDEHVVQMQGWLGA
jgi:hypothetical protein